MSKSIECKVSSTKVSVSKGKILDTTKYRYFFRVPKSNIPRNLTVLKCVTVLRYVVGGHTINSFALKENKTTLFLSC